MKHLALAALAVVAAAPALAQPAPMRVTVTVTDHGFRPHNINLIHGAPYAIHLVNVTGRKHNMEAPEFFAASGAVGGGIVREGRVELEPGQSATVRLTAPQGPGRFPFKSSLVTDAASGMSGYFIIR